MKIKTIILLILFWAFNLVANEDSIFWELESPEGKQIFIFGSIHVDDNRVVDFSNIVNKAMQKSDLFVSETNNVSNLKALEGLGSEYTDYLSEEDFQKINELSDFHSLETDFAIKLKPWLLVLFFKWFKGFFCESCLNKLLQKPIIASKVRCSNYNKKNIFFC